MCSCHLISNISPWLNLVDLKSWDGLANHTTLVRYIFCWLGHFKISFSSHYNESFKEFFSHLTLPRRDLDILCRFSLCRFDKLRLPLSMKAGYSGCSIFLMTRRSRVQSPLFKCFLIERLSNRNNEDNVLSFRISGLAFPAFITGLSTLARLRSTLSIVNDYENTPIVC